VYFLVITINIMCVYINVKKLLRICIKTKSTIQISIEIKRSIRILITVMEIRTPLANITVRVL
jgi:hypothetical protein